MKITRNCIARGRQIMRRYTHWYLPIIADIFARERIGEEQRVLTTNSPSDIRVSSEFE